MSWYTTVYPEWGFVKEFDDIERVKNELSMLDVEIKKAWNKISDMAWLSIDAAHFWVMREELDKAISEYISLQEKEYFMVVCKEMLEMKADGEKPSISVNHYRWSRCPQGGIDESNKMIDDAISGLRGLCFANIRDIVPLNDADGCPTEPIDYVVALLRDYKEQIDDAINDREFSKICVRFWDTHEEG